MKELQELHNRFYKRTTKKDQDIFLFKFCSIKPIKTRPTTKGKKKFTTKYSVFLNKKKVPICQLFFLNIFGVKKFRVEYIMKKFFETGEFAHEARGGNRKAEKFAPQKESIRQFIESLQCMDSHYCRKTKLKERKYLSSELNIHKLYKISTKTVQIHSQPSESLLF
jgi:hypothetical protein